MSGSGVTREQFEVMVVAKAAEDEVFRAKLIASPKAAIEEAFGKALPAGLSISVVQETTDSMVLVLPDFAMLAANDELSDEQVKMVAAGASTSTGTCGSSNCSLGCSTSGSTFNTGILGTIGWRTNFNIPGF